MENFWEILRARRCVRKFDPTKPVTDEQIDKLLEAAILAPSSGNTQGWRFYVVRDQKTKEDLATRAGHQKFISEAPVVIVVCADLDHIERSYGARGRETYALQDTAAAIENIFLSVTAMGLATCWIGAFDEGSATKILDLPKGTRPVAMLPIAYPADTPKPPKRRPLEEVVKRI